MKGSMERTLMWCGSVLVAVSVAVAFLFMTFQTVADAGKTEHYFDSRLDKIETKIDTLLEQNK